MLGSRQQTFPSTQVGCFFPLCFGAETTNTCQERVAKLSESRCNIGLGSGSRTFSTAELNPIPICAHADLCDVTRRSVGCASEQKNEVFVCLSVCLSVCLFALHNGIHPPQRLPGQNLSTPPPQHQRVREATQRNQTSPHSRTTLAARRCSCQPDFFFTTGGRTDSFMSALAVAFTETPKETVFTDPQRRVNGVPLFFIPAGPRACRTFKLAFSCPAPAGHEGSAWMKHLTDIFSHPQPPPLFPFCKKISAFND